MNKREGGSKKDNFHVGIIQSIRSMDQSNQERKTEDGLDLFLSPTTQRSFSFFFFFLPENLCEELDETNEN